MKVIRVLIAIVAAGTVAAFTSAFAPSPIKTASPEVYIDMGTKAVIDPVPHTIHAHGSGIDIGDGYVLTAAHVADAAPEGFKDPLKIIDSLGNKHQAEVLWANHHYDVALLRVSDPAGIAASHLSCRLLDHGERLTFQGNPFDLHDITTRGRVANPAITALGPWAAGMTVNGNIDPGMSGGPAFDAYGNVVGINVGTIKGSGLGFIVPGHVICALLGPSH